ncbi:integrin alpha-M-like protein [Labeo rohita]|uniref:Integrin alpha-M-like protein n=1 Tax=Labeo rohita TaxID=84645 RepID=A0A498MRL1_LABRO|nr:integrin alpha-M-like protein [Labeo rohita]
MSLGLSMVQDPRSSKLAICGPTISKKCVTVTTYNGMCFISENNVLKPPIPSVLRDCPDQIDIAFLLDGSGSVGTSNFVTMKTFVVNMIKRFTERDGQFAIAQYSHNCEIHYNFNNLKIQDSTWESKVKAIPYNGGTQSSGDSSRMEFAQDGFSTAFTAYKSVLVSAVGAFQWKGGYQEYFPNSSFRRGIEHESYLVSLAEGNLGRGTNQAAFENRSTTTQMTVWPWEGGSPVTKSRERCDQGLRGTGKAVVPKLGNATPRGGMEL